MVVRFDRGLGERFTKTGFQEIGRIRGFQPLPWREESKARLHRLIIPVNGISGSVLTFLSPCDELNLSG